MTESNITKKSIPVQIFNLFLIGLITFLALKLFKHGDNQVAEPNVEILELAELLNFQSPGKIGTSLESMEDYDIKKPLVEGVVLSTGNGGEFIVSMKNKLNVTLEGTSSVQLFDNSLDLLQGGLRLNGVDKKYPENFIFKIKNKKVELKELPAEYQVE